MTDKDLLKILEENGYAPSNENLNILKEEFSKDGEILTEGKVKKFLKRAWRAVRGGIAGAAGAVVGGLVGGLPGAAVGGAIGAGTADAVHQKKEGNEDSEGNKVEVKESYTDFELIQILEENGYPTTYKNVQTLREGLLNGTILFEEEEVDEPAEDADEDFAELFSDDEDTEVPDTTAEVEEITNEIKKSAAEQKAERINEAKLSYKTNEMIKNFLLEECGVDVEYLNEAAEQATIKTVVNDLFATISEKLQMIDTSVADRSRGDITSLKELQPIQTAITQLEAMIERADKFVPEAAEYIRIIIKSIIYINQYSNVFKEAYRNKKTLLILKYESLILAIISAVSYMISSLVDVNVSGADIRLKDEIVIEKIAPIKTLEAFNQSVVSGEFKNITRDINVLREYYCEVSVNQLSQLLEAGDILSVVVDGVKNFLSSVSNNGKLTNILYKATGIVVLLFSLRDIFYSLFRMKTKVSDMVNGISSFANINLGGQLNKLLQFTNKFKTDAENATDLAKREVEDENRKISTQVRAAQLPFEVETTPSPVQTQAAETNSLNDILFDF